MDICKVCAKEVLNVIEENKKGRTELLKANKIIQDIEEVCRNNVFGSEQALRDEILLLVIKSKHKESE